MPIGLRGVGKTVLLNTFIDVAEREGLKVGYIEAPETGDLRRLLAIRLRRILLDLDRVGRASRAVDVRSVRWAPLRTTFRTAPRSASVSMLLRVSLTQATFQMT